MGDAYDAVTVDRENNASKTKIRLMGNYIDLMLRDDESDQEEETQQKKLDILYVVEPLDEGTGDDATWEGHLSAVKRFTQKAVIKTENSLMQRVEKVYDRVIEAEGRDVTSDREMKTGLSTLMAEVKNQKKQIETLAHRQDEKHAELEGKISEILEGIQNLQKEDSF